MRFLEKLKDMEGKKIVEVKTDLYLYAAYNECMFLQFDDGDTIVISSDSDNDIVVIESSFLSYDDRFLLGMISKKEYNYATEKKEKQIQNIREHKEYLRLKQKFENNT